MKRTSNTRFLTIELSENHPLFELDKDTRTIKAQEALDSYYGEQQTIKQRLEELNSKVELLLAGMTMIHEILYNVRDIRNTVNNGISRVSPIEQKPVARQIVKKPDEQKEVKEQTEVKTVQIDIDAFFDLG